VELFELTQAGEVIIHVVTNTTNVQALAAPGAFDNVLTGNRANGNAVFDGFDGNLDPPCDNNRWVQNQFGTVNQPCVGSPITPAAAAADGPQAAQTEASESEEGGLELTRRGQVDGSAVSASEVS
jgi:hypothetical protein